MEWRTTGYTLEDTDAGMVRLNYEFYEDAQSRDTYDLARRINRDCLILHGERDDTVPLEQSRALAEALGPRAELHIIPNATHAFSGPSELQKVMRKTEGFFRDRLRTRV